ncbi:unnamed protein product [Calypogeia fissa]
MFSRGFYLFYINMAPPSQVLDGVYFVQTQGNPYDGTHTTGMILVFIDGRRSLVSPYKVYFSLFNSGTMNR